MKRIMSGKWLRGCALAAFAMMSVVPVLAQLNVNSTVRAYNSAVSLTYVSVEVGNPTSVPALCSLEFKGWSSSSSNEMITRMDLPEIPPGSSRIVNVPVPSKDVNSGRLIHRNGRGDHPLTIQTSNYGNPDYKGYLNVVEPANSLTDLQLDAFTMRLHPDASRYGHSSSSSTTRTLSEAERNISQMAPEAMPEDWRCFAPVYRVFIADSAERRLTSPQREALNTYLTLGGKVTIYGASEDWTETVGRGERAYARSNPLLTGQYSKHAGGTPLEVFNDLNSAVSPYRETRGGGRYGAFSLATLFLILVGPVNYFYHAKRQQLRRIIITVPLISLAFCSLIGVYFIFTQGFSRKGGSISLTTIDEASNRAVTFARHSLLSGLYPLGGFHFSPQTYFLRNSGDDSGGGQFDLTNELKLVSGVFQPGIPFNYSTIMPYTSRERLIYKDESGEVVNGFELPIKAVAVWDDGKFLRGASVQPGASLKLTAVDESELSAAMPIDIMQGERSDDVKVARLAMLAGQHQLDTEELNNLRDMAQRLAKDVNAAEGPIYAVVFDAIPKTSDSGVVISEGKNLHVLMGIMQAEGTQEEQQP